MGKIQSIKGRELRIGRGGKGRERKKAEEVGNGTYEYVGQQTEQKDIERGRDKEVRAG
jgi:hypothetical protein